MSTPATQAKIGIVASAGGSAVMELVPYLRARGLEFVVATDRACGIEESCAAHSIPYQRFAYTARDRFSQTVAEYFQAQGVAKLVLLLYPRFVGTPLYEQLPTWNIHPALLPSFPGLNPIQQQLDHKAPLLGATLHEVDASCDGGPILGQIANSYMPAQAERISFLQKTYLALAAIDRQFPQGAQSHFYLNASLALSHAAHTFFRSVEEKYAQRILT
jgi:phosphoribosylglycinamide formyltransferase-1